MNVAIIGASDNPQRYAYKALLLLKQQGHTVFAVHQRLKEIAKQSVYSSISKVPDSIDTVSLYVASDISSVLSDEILEKFPRRIIFNPGAENPVLFKMALSRGIIALNACTILLLKTGQF